MMAEFDGFMSGEFALAQLRFSRPPVGDFDSKD